MDTRTALNILTDALEHCRKKDMRTPDVSAALDFLAKRASAKWPFDQFQRALDSDHEEGRWQTLNASLNAIRLALTPATVNRSESTRERKREWVFEPDPRRPRKKC
jgi:hypothetical protein